MFGKKSPPITEAWRGITFTRRAIVVGGAQTALFGALAARMAYISVIDNERYVLESESNRVNLTLVPPRRGWIVDRHGKALANNRVSLRVDIIPDRLHNKDLVLGQLKTLLRPSRNRARSSSTCPSCPAWRRSAALRATIRPAPRSAT